ncbi:S-methyl-5'-thioinosine phosphorylase [Silvimonas iriomotensis]|uniref:Probable 6-oxopurine nucleoside phosphorylase n=1 Tax=Silvimonas iriomotensis TaxID=449662 RepID=A0ABQ2P545_9NEIS|nr:S-methyl-5'-thioinosine phosphorylase [Silvimonas iriomotensis]GGP18582.1 putative S-methyl-5'-thioinosine phosphorylase [Silvimonas iriomotensis]
MLALIGGTGAGQPANLQITNRLVVRTPYGDPSGALTFGEVAGRPVVFIARHGYGHTIPPHLINYRANIWALTQQHVTHIVAIASVGGIRADMSPGTLVVPDQILDYTWGRKQTMFEVGEHPVTHVDFTEPYNAELRAAMLDAAQQTQVKLVDGGTYACTQGPRLETAAEIRRIQNDGGDMVGMTGMPEAVLAREAGVPYATLAVVSNWAAGVNTSQKRIVMEDASEIVRQSLSGGVYEILSQLVKQGQS